MPSKVLEFSAPTMSLGVNLQSDQLKLGELMGGRSARFERGGGIFTGPGYRSVEDLGTSTGGDAMLEATVFPALWVKSGTKLFYSTDPDNTTFYNTGDTLTTGTKSSLIEQGNGDVFLTNQTDAPLRVAVAKATVAIAATDVTITVGAAYIGKFAANGNVRVNDDVIAYTGKNATQLTGVTGIQAGGHAINSLVIQSTNPATWTEEKGKFMFEFQSQLCVGGRVNYENILYGSRVESAANPEYFYDFDGAGTVNHIYKNNLAAGIAGIGRAFVFGHREAHQVTGFDGTSGAFLTTPISTSYGAYNEKCVVDMEGIIAFLGNKRLLPLSLQLSPEGTSAPFITENFDDRIRPWLDSLDDEDEQSDANLFYDTSQKLLKISARRNSVLETYVYDRQANAFLPQESRPGAVHCSFQGKSFFVGTTGIVYREDFGRTNDGITIYHSWKTGRMSMDKGRKPLQLYVLEFEGYMSQACEYTVNLYTDKNETAVLSRDFTDSDITSTVGVSIGSRGIGVSTIGGETGAYKVYPYHSSLLLRGIECDSDVQIEWVCQKAGAYFQLNSYKLTCFPIRRSNRTSN